jgi:hypothetical protein
MIHFSVRFILVSPFDWLTKLTTLAIYSHAYLLISGDNTNLPDLPHDLTLLHNLCDLCIFAGPCAKTASGSPR